MERCRQYKPFPGFSLQPEEGNCQRWPALGSRDGTHYPGAQIGCCLASAWHWVISLQGRLGRWFLKGRISLLALVLRMPVMQAGQLAESSLLPRSLPCTQPAFPAPGHCILHCLFHLEVVLPCSGTGLASTWQLPVLPGSLPSRGSSVLLDSSRSPKERVIP